MSKLYGERWKVVANLGRGGQGVVFRVKDISGNHPGEYALKRVLNPDRRARFRAEIDAVKSLSHPNIIPLIDHSALDEEASADMQYLVMPIAEGGDLSAPGRRALYTDSIDAVLKVALQLASALDAAHEAGIIHRDVKPQNILFTGTGHEVLLSDFGICLLREKPRITPEDEIVGPRAFMAPELEEGGQLNVTPAADIYSLGKVIFYMLSGGLVIPRERLDDPRVREVFSKGERHRLLELLLGRMICISDARIGDMAAVSRELETIKRWENNARLLAASKTGLAGIARLKQISMTAARMAAENADARNQEAATIERVRASVGEMIEVELGGIAAHISTPPLTAESRVINSQECAGLNLQIEEREFLQGIAGAELRVGDKGQALGGRIHILQVFLCRKNTVVFTILRGTHPAGQTIQPPRDIEFVLLPVYRLQSTLGYLSTRRALGTMRARLDSFPGASQRLPTPRSFKVQASMRHFARDICQHLEFRASAWPGNAQQMRAAISEAIDMFVEILNPEPTASC